MLGVTARELGIEPGQYRVHQYPQLADRMVGRNTLFHRNVGEHAKLLLIGLRIRLRGAVN